MMMMALPDPFAIELFPCLLRERIECWRYAVRIPHGLICC